MPTNELMVVQAFDTNGNVVPGAQFNFYQAGTTTRQAVYSDEALTTALPNPVIADAAGRATLYLDNSLVYKFNLKDAAGVTNLIPDIDNYTPRQDSLLYFISVDVAAALLGSQTAQTAAEAAQTAAEAAQTAAETAQTAAETAETNAQSSETAAAASASAASTSASNASTSETNAASSASAASTSATNASNSETAAQAAQTAAETAETNAETAEANAEAWATQAVGTGKVGGTDWSSKAYAQGNLAGANGGSAKDWAVTAEDTLVNATEYSSKHHAAKASTSASNANVDAIAAAAAGAQVEQIFLPGTHANAAAAVAAHPNAAVDTVFRLTTGALHILTNVSPGSEASDVYSGTITTPSDITGISAFAETFLDDANQAAVQATLGVTSTADLASTANTLGASLIGVEDSGGNFTGTTVEAVLAELAGNSGDVDGVADKTALQALTLAGTSAISGVLVRDADYGGLFIRTTTDIQTEVTADTQAAVYVPFSGANGSTGGFIRVLHNNSIKAKWYGAVGDNSTDDTTALQAAIDSGFVIDLGVDGDVYKTTSALTVPANTRFIPSRARIHADHTGIALDLQGSNIKLNGVRVYSTKSDISVTNVTAANPAVITLASGHGLANGDRIKFPEMTSGMVELSGRSFEIAGLSGDTANIQNFTLGSGLANLDTSSYTAWSGSETTTKYDDGHRGIFGQITTFSGGITPNYFDDVEVDGCEVEGFGAEGIRIDFTNRLKARSNKISRCGTHGGLFLSPIDFDISDNDVSDIGPGVTASNAGYGISVSRVTTYNDDVSTVEATLSESPRPTNGKIVQNVVKGLRDYCAIDLHSCENVIVSQNNTDKCCMGVNVEHASSTTIFASCEDLTITDNQIVGNDGGEYSVGPGVAVDAHSGAGEIVEGCIIGNNLVKHHGKSGAHPLFTDSAAIYCVESDGVIVDGNSFHENYSRDFLAKSDATNFSVTNNISKGLNAVSSVQTMIVCKEAGTSGRIAGNTYINSGGELFEVDGAPSRLVNICENETITDGREITFESDNVVRGGAEMMTTTSRGYLQIGSYVTGHDFQLIYNGTQGVAARSVSTITLSGTNPVEVTTTASHNLSTGDRVYFINIVGTTELNNKGWIITSTGSTTFTLDNTDSSNFTAYTSGGTMYKLLEPYSLVQRNPEKRFKYIQYNSTGIVNLRYDTTRFNDVIQAIYPIVASSANARAFLFSSSSGLSQVETTDNADAATDYATVIVSMDGI